MICLITDYHTESSAEAYDPVRSVLSCLIRTIHRIPTLVGNPAIYLSDSVWRRLKPEYDRAMENGQWFDAPVGIIHFMGVPVYVFEP